MGPEKRQDIIDIAICDAATVASQICESAGGKIKPQIIEHSRKSTLAGKAIDGRVIELNLRLLTNASDYRDTLYHELAHIVCFHCYGPKQGHGKNWKNVMAMLGQEPKRCHSIDMCRVMPERFTFAICQTCGSRMSISRRKATKIGKYCCRKCGGSIKAT